MLYFNCGIIICLKPWTFFFHTMFYVTILIYSKTDIGGYRFFFLNRPIREMWVFRLSKVIFIISKLSIIDMNKLVIGTFSILWGDLRKKFFNIHYGTIYVLGLCLLYPPTLKYWVPNSRYLQYMFILNAWELSLQGIVMFFKPFTL